MKTGMFVKRSIMQMNPCLNGVYGAIKNANDEITGNCDLRKILSE